MNKLTSVHTQIPYDYYSLKFCRPHGGIKRATQGYFSIDARDGEGGEGGSDTPYKKVRVVTTVDFYLR